MTHPNRSSLALLIAVTLTAMAISVIADETRIDDQSLTSDEARLSYSLGQQIGDGIKEQRLEIEFVPFLRGIRDVLTNAEPLLAPEEMDRLRMAYFQKRKQEAERERKELAKKNLKSGRAFLAENARQEGVVVLPSGLQYKVIKTGNGKQPGETDWVSINYRGTLIDGTEIGNSFGREMPVKLRLDTAIPGQAQALRLMREGDKWQTFIPTELAYGEQGRKGLVGPNEALIIEVELLAVSNVETELPVVLPELGEAVPEKLNTMLPLE